MSGIGWFQNFSNYFSSSERTEETTDTPTTPPASTVPSTSGSTISSLGGTTPTLGYLVHSQVPSLEQYLTSEQSGDLDKNVPLGLIQINAKQLGSVVGEMKLLIAGSSMPSDQKTSLMSILTAVEQAIADLEGAIKNAEEKDAEIRRRLIALTVAAADLVAAGFTMKWATHGMSETEKTEFWRLMNSTEKLSAQMERYRGCYNMIQQAGEGMIAMDDSEAIRKLIERMLAELDALIKQMIANLVLKLDTVEFQDMYGKDIDDAQKALEVLGFSPQLIQEVQDLLLREIVHDFLGSPLSIEQVALNLVNNDAFMGGLIAKAGEDVVSQKLLAVLITLNIGNISMHFMNGTDEEVMPRLGILMADIAASPTISLLLGLELSSHFQSNDFSNNFNTVIQQLTDTQGDKPTNFATLLEVAEEMAEESKDLITEMVKNLAMLKKLLAMLLSGMPLQEIAKIAGMADTVKNVMSHMEPGDSSGIAA